MPWCVFLCMYSTWGSLSLLNLWVYRFLQNWEYSSHYFSPLLLIQILACGIPELWHDSTTLRDHLTVLGSPSLHCRLGGSKRKWLQEACWGSLSGLISLFPLSQDQFHAACCPVCENCCFIYSIQLSGSYYSITSRNRTILGHPKATV